MSLPGTRELEGAIAAILSRARDDGRLSQLTVRLVRQELATQFDLDEDVLNSGKYKSFIKDTVHTAVATLQNASDEGAEPPRRKAAKKAKSDGVVKAGPRKRELKAQVQPPDEEPSEEARAFEGDAPPPRKASAPPKASKPVRSAKTSKKPESEVKYKSKALIESSDEEAAPESETRQPARLPKTEQMSTKSSALKHKQQRRVNKNNSDIEIGTGDGPGLSSSSSKLERAIDSPKASVSKAKEMTRDPMESELSSVVDEPPKKRQKKQEKELTKSQKDEKTKRGKKDVLSKDDETVNRLKGIVIACGMRKVWKKEFEGLDKPSQQIKRLHSILGDLGMAPRYSLEKAKAIRERRELAQELKDVQEFEKATTKRGKGVRSSFEIAEFSDQDDSDANVPAPKKQNARASIMAFLQDQSEEE